MRSLPIAYGNSRFAVKWSNKETSWDELCRRLQVPKHTTETVVEYAKMTKPQRDGAKDVGGFVTGHLRKGRRKSNTEAYLSMLKLDADKAEKDFLIKLAATHQYECVVYSTHSHTSEAPRFRILIPLTRNVTPEEFAAISRYVANDYGIDQFDPCSYIPHQLMYWPSCPSDGNYCCERFDGDWLDPDVLLAEHPDWRDCAMLPTANRESAVIQHELGQQADPLAKDGVIGAFCRAFTIEEAIAAFLPDIYEPSVTAGRYDYIPADSSAGVVIYDGKWVYSHHASDPASGKLLNAFDLVRVHKFGDADEKASFNAMREFAVKDETVGALLLAEKQAHAAADFTEDTDWEKKLTRDKSGQLHNSLHNIRLILENDPNLNPLVFNQLADGLEIKGDVPWKHPARFWRDADDAQLISYVDSHYGTFSDRNYTIAITKVADDRSYHPIREYLDALPPWDGVERVETLLIVYLGAEDNKYVRTVTRKTLCAAIARVLNPGIKFDNILVMNGPQGVGKSTLILKLGGEWYSDSLALTDMNDKTAAEKLQGYWLLEIGELAGMRKADIDKVKAFISRQDDKYRASFGRRVTPHPRQCVFFGTTNSEKGYLRDVTGNRRFWTVKTPGGGDHHTWQITKEDVQQIWAEVLTYVRAGEKLYLDADLEDLARGEQREAMEHDEREGLVREYLDRLLPDNWDTMNFYERRDYIRDPDDPTHSAGTVRRDIVSNIEVWCECFGKPKEDIKPADSYAIAAIMERIESWEKSGAHANLKIYGKQRIYTRRNK